MKPASFSYLSPKTVPEAVKMIAEHSEDARFIAGGQSLVPMMNFRLARPSVLIDLNRIPDLSYIKDCGNHIAVGAMTRERMIENSYIVRDMCPLVHDATLNIAHLPIRSRGTIGGSISNADPAAEYPATMLALDALMVARSERGEREIMASDFFEGVLTTSLKADEILTEVRIPKAPANSGSAFIEISRRQGDYALAGIAAQLTLDNDKKIMGIQLAACGVGPGPVRLNEVEDSIRGRTLTGDTLLKAREAASAAVDPEGDVHATAAYRRKLTGAITERALKKAALRAVGKE